jgi:hypothetical protein
MNQLTMNLGGLSGTETVTPYAAGDVLVTNSGKRLVVTQVERDADAAQPEVLLCVRLDNGANCVVFPREIAYRSR